MLFVRIAYIVTFAMLPFFLWTNLFLSGVYHYYFGYYSKAGILHPISLAFFFGLFIRGFMLLLFRLLKPRTTDSAEFLIQLRYIFAAFIIALVAAIDFIPKYGLEFYPFGFMFTISFLLVTAYAIVKHQVMGIEVIIKKTLVFAGLLASVFAILVLPTLFIQEYILRTASFAGRMAGLTISGIIIILSMRRIEGFLINITDKYLFQKRYNYKELLKTFTAEVLTVINLDKLVNLTVDKLADIVKINSCAVLLFDNTKQQFNVMASYKIKDPQVTLIRPDGIVTFLEQTQGYLLKKELIERRVFIPPSIQDIIDKLNAELIVPMVLHNEVAGILSLGKKKSDEDYTQDDLDILLPLARTLAIAISNAKLFDELGKTQAEAAQNEKMAVIGTLSAGINHEICNPLGIARGQCEAFLLNIKDGLYNDKSTEELLSKAKEIMTKVIKETDRATAITKKLSGFAKPAKGEAELVNVSKEVDDVLGLVGYELKLEKIEFDKQIEKGLPDIMVDKKQFQEVLFNLIRNAGQAIGEKGRITLIAKEDNRKVLIDIKDTGSGIPEDKLKELFNPFFTTKEPGKGTGLGLFIVRQVVEKNGGRIYLKETKVGEGTTFTIEFPIAAPQESRV
jgi:signal transduction histidine kinase